MLYSSLLSSLQMFPEKKGAKSNLYLVMMLSVPLHEKNYNHFRARKVNLKLRGKVVFGG